MKNLILYSIVLLLVFSCKDSAKEGEQETLEALQKKLDHQDSLLQAEKVQDLENREQMLKAREDSINESLAKAKKEKSSATAKKSNKSREEIYSSHSTKLHPDECKSAIYNFVYAEDERDLESITNLLSNKMDRYWSVKNPTKANISKIYKDAWRKMSFSENEIQDVKRVNNNTYDLYTNFTFKNSRTGEVKIIKNKVRFKFNPDYKITYINEL